jgi:predicted DNA-binding transcriptional regulator AlpA
MSTIPLSSTRMITAHRVMDKLKISRAMLRKLIATGQFPKSSSEVGQARWEEQTVDQWLRSNKQNPVTRRRGEQ